MQRESFVSSESSFFSSVGMWEGPESDSIEWYRLPKLWRGTEVLVLRNVIFPMLRLVPSDRAGHAFRQR